MDESNDQLWQCPPIIKNIFKHLDARDLSNCAKVCSLWNSMSITENNRRRYVVWFLETYLGQTIEADGSITDKGPEEGELHLFQYKVRDVRIRPSFCIAFTTPESLNYMADHQPSPPVARRRKKAKKAAEQIIIKKMKALHNNFRPYLPVQCQLHCITSPGVIGCHYQGSPTEVEEGRAISGILLPHFPGVNIEQYSLNTLKEFQNTKLLDPPIKGMLLFGNRPTISLVKGFVGKCVKHNGDEQFAIGGAIVEPGVEDFGMCFLFSGDNLQAASIVIDESTTDVGAELAMFGKTGMLENHCFAFMFACVDKGINKYRVPHYESRIFCNMYPGVPLAGVFGNGEIGTHFLPNVDLEDEELKKRSQKFTSKNCLRAYNTIFVLFSVKITK